MEKLEIFTEAQVRDLINELSNIDRLEQYQKEPVFRLSSELSTLRSNITLGSNNCELLANTHSRQTLAADDAENAIRVFEYLGPLPRAQAVDKRLWTTLCHSEFWEYTQKRWPVSQLAPSSALSIIKVHWFVGGSGLAGLRRNSVSRLWWAAQLTYAPWVNDSEYSCFECDDPSRFTKIMLSQQQIFSDVMERSFGSSKKIRICYLDALDKGMSELKNKDSLVKESSKNLGILLKHKQLSAMHIDEVRTEMTELINSCNAA